MAGTSRASPTHEDSRGHEGFGPSGEGVAIDTTLHGWQTAGDRRLFKLIISPEFGERMDLKKLTRDLIAEMECDLGTRLEWVAAEHHNTEYPHVHVALRGIDSKVGLCNCHGSMSSTAFGKTLKNLPRRRLGIEPRMTEK
jgi:hypothetical protein